jgi:hypothetical protein
MQWNLKVISVELHQSIDYRCESSGFLVSVCCVIVSSPKSLSSRETGVDSGKKQEEKPTMWFRF